ncbi:MAG: sulfatase-like hydrolase/transferase [Thermoleophilaceae bacterium]|nr:sulfatase-like hydrolase/transferase [Thermoleophilaceae bacterium]
MRVTRRSLLRRGGATAAGTAFLGAAGAPSRARAQPGDDRARNAVLVVLPLVRATHVNAFDGDSPAETPNLDDLTGDSLRFDRAIPESMPALPARRALITGMRAFPFRDWRKTEGMPAVPGFNRIYDHQPVMTEAMRASGVTTAYVSDNPILEARRFPDVRRTTDVAAVDRTVPGVDSELLPSLARATRATARTFRAGIRELERLQANEPFFLAIDSFDPADAFEAPPVYVRPGEVELEGVGPLNGRLVELAFGGGDVDRVRERYVAHVEAVDRWVGRLMDRMAHLDLLDRTVVYVLGDHGVSLGEHDYLGRATPTSHRESYEVPYLIRHPGGEMAGDDVDWYASTHDVAPTLLSFLGLTIPGKMEGEDLTALFDGVDEDDLPDRPKSITAVGSCIIVRDSRWLMVADREEIERRLYDDDEETDDDNDDKRYDNVANDEPGILTELSLTALNAAGGTLPEFGREGALRPPPQRGDDDMDDDGIPNDFDAVDNDEPDDDSEPEDLRFDGRNP